MEFGLQPVFEPMGFGGAITLAIEVLDPKWPQSILKNHPLGSSFCQAGVRGQDNLLEYFHYISSNRRVAQSRHRIKHKKAETAQLLTPKLRKCAG